MIKTPLRYPGGKSKALKDLIPHIPSFAEYREPFVGGGSLFIHLKQVDPGKKFWINDLNFNLYSFWKVLKKDKSSLIESVFKTRQQSVSGKDLYYELKDTKKMNQLERATKFFILNRITFSGLVESGGYSEQAFLRRFTINSIENLNLVSEILSKTVITNYDYEDVMKKKGSNVFIFLDPPYMTAAKYPLYGKRGDLHKEFDYEKFSYVAKNCEHKWMITLDDMPELRRLFKFAKIKKLNLQYGMNNVNKTVAKRGKEILITNF
jgi:DNA adenine methylase